MIYCTCRFATRRLRFSCLSIAHAAALQLCSVLGVVPLLAWILILTVLSLVRAAAPSPRVLTETLTWNRNLLYLQIRYEAAPPFFLLVDRPCCGVTALGCSSACLDFDLDRPFSGPDSAGMVIICGCSFSEIETSLVVLSVAGLVVVVVVAEAVVVDLVLVVEPVELPPLV